MFFKIVVALLSEGLRRARDGITIVTQVIHSQVVSPSKRTVDAFLHHSFSLSEFVVRSYSLIPAGNLRVALPLGRLSRCDPRFFPLLHIRRRETGPVARPLAAHFAVDAQASLRAVWGATASLRDWARRRAWVN